MRITKTKRKRHIRYNILLWAIFYLFFLASVSLAFSGSGSGTEQAPYIITNVNQLQEMNDGLDAWYELGNDIDASATSGWNNGEGFLPIDTFLGHFDGKNRTISNLYINRNMNCVGLFGIVGGGWQSEIKNVGLVEVDITGWDNVGGLVGYHNGGILKIDNCFSTGIVKGGGAVGGLVGVATGDVSNSYSTAIVNGRHIVGGLIGDNLAFVSNSYSTGNVSGQYSPGGLIGRDWGTCTSSFWDTETSGQSTSDCGTGKTTAEMKQRATFTNWDFDEIWDITEGVSYPFLRELSTGEANHDPQLSNGYVDPAPGDTETDFYWYVDYYDEDGDAPLTKNVYIDGTSHVMNLYSGSAANGTYRYGPIKLGEGDHDFSFLFMDEYDGTDSLPSSDTYSGPIVGEISFSEGQVINLIQLTNGSIAESGCTFNTDGTKIAYRNMHSPYSWNNCDIWVMNTNGSSKTQITTDSRGEFDPRFAPNGQITYTKEFGSNDYDLWTVNGDGSNPHSLIDGSYRQTTCRWHPSGNKLVYCSEYQYQGPSEIWTANADGSDKVQLTNHAIDGYRQGESVYSRSGNLIAYTNTVTSTSKSAVWVMNANGSGKHQITSGSENQNPMFWWTDDTRIGYTQNGEVWLHNLTTGTDELLLSVPNSQIHQCDLSPDGTRLVFYLDAHIWIGDVSSGQLNHAPQLSNGYVDPASGDTETDFYWYVDYYDEDGDAPSTKNVYVDGAAHVMNHYSGSAANGTYRYGPINLSEGDHDFSFRFTDEHGGEGYWPSSPPYAGPVVEDIILPIIRGLVMFYDGDVFHPISGVKIEADGKQAWTDTNGEYELTGLSPGDITITVSKDGYETQTEVLTSIQAGQIYNADFELQTIKVDLNIKSITLDDNNIPEVANILSFSVRLQNKHNVNDAHNVWVSFCHEEKVIATRGLGTLNGGDQYTVENITLEFSQAVEDYDITVALTCNEADIDLANNSKELCLNFFYDNNDHPFTFKINNYNFKNNEIPLVPEDPQKWILDMLRHVYGDDPFTSLYYISIAPILEPILTSLGHCYGMASTSIMYKQDPSLIPLGKENTHILTKDEALPNITTYCSFQVPHLTELAYPIATYDASVEYQILRDSLKNQQKSMMLLGGNHAVSAYAIAELNGISNPDIYGKNIFYYDNNGNKPAHTYFGNNKFANGHTIVRDPVTSYPNELGHLISDYFHLIAKTLADTGQKIFSLHCPAHMVLEDQYGRQTGYVNDQYISEIPDCNVVVVDGGEFFTVPSDLQYNVTITGTDQGSCDFDIVVPTDQGTVDYFSWRDIPLEEDSTIAITSSPTQPASTAASSLGQDYESDKASIVLSEMAKFEVTKLTVKAGKGRDFSKDALSVLCTSFEAAETELSNADNIYIDIYNAGEDEPIFSDMIPFDPAKLKKGKYSGKNSTTSIKFDINLKTLQLFAKNIDLTGLCSPVNVQVEIGDYFGEGIAYDGEVLASGGQTDVINGKKPVPLKLLSGCEDSLRVDKCTFKLGTKKPNTDSLVIQGAIAVEDTSVDIAGEDIVVSWGDYDITLPANDLYRIGPKKVFKYKKPKDSDSSIAAAIFDLEKCTFKIIVKKTNISSQNNPIDFSMQFADFSKTVTLQLTEKKSDYWCFP